MKQPANSLLTIESEAGYKIYKSGRKEKVFTCRCQCGNLVEKAQSNLTKAVCCSIQCPLNPCKTAGIKEKTYYKLPEYKVWEGMKQRCCNPNNKKYKNYGGRGIKVCDEWNTFVKFYNDMGPRPTPEHTIERIDVNKGYNPDNCIWLHKSKQARNTTRNVVTKKTVDEIRSKFVPYKYTIKMLAEEYNLNFEQIKTILYKNIWK